LFYDSTDVYVWLYEPLSTKTLLLGGVVLIGVVAATLFPLWPPWCRVGVYYVAVAAGLFVGSVLGVAFLRSIFFMLVWLCTAGKYHIWFLPNLLADVGFFESFKPVYTIDYYPSSNDSDSKDEDKGKEDDSNKEENPETTSEDTTPTSEAPPEDTKSIDPDSKAAGDSEDPTVNSDPDEGEAKNVTKSEETSTADEEATEDSNNDYVMVDSPNHEETAAS